MGDHLVTILRAVADIYLSLLCVSEQIDKLSLPVHTPTVLYYNYYVFNNKHELKIHAAKCSKRDIFIVENPGSCGCNGITAKEVQSAMTGLRGGS